MTLSLIKRRPKNKNFKKPHNNSKYTPHDSGNDRSTAPGSKLYHKAIQNRDKFLEQGKDAMHSGDRVVAEYWFQHADHYNRIVLEANALSESRRIKHEQENPAEGAPHHTASAAPVDSDDDHDDHSFHHALPVLAPITPRTTEHSRPAPMEEEEY